MGVVVEVRPPGAVVEEPRVRGPAHALDEPLRVGAPLVVEQGEHRDGDLLDLLERSVTSGVDEALVERDVAHPIRPRVAVDHLGEEVGVAPLGVHVRHGEKAVEIVEPDVLGLARLVLSHVPLPDGLGHVARLGEELGQRHLAAEPPGHAVHRRDEQAVAHGQAAGHDGRPRRRAGRLAVARREQQPLPGEPVDVRRRCADRDAPAVATEVPPADVVHQDDQDIGPPTGPCREGLELGGRRLGATGHHEGGLAVRGRRGRRARDGIHALVWSSVVVHRISLVIEMPVPAVRYASPAGPVVPGSRLPGRGNVSSSCRPACRCRSAPDDASRRSPGRPPTTTSLAPAAR